jgi:hypothetical protein
MAIQVASSVHAAATMFAVPAPGEESVRYLQSPQGCIIQRLHDDESDIDGWMFLLDYGLDVGSTGFSCSFFASLDPETLATPQTATPILGHIDDRVKLLILLAKNEDGKPQVINQSFHALFLNFQANQQELYPVDLGTVPDPMRG